jgi:hypothetical protein
MTCADFYEAVCTQRWSSLSEVAAVLRHVDECEACATYCRREYEAMTPQQRELNEKRFAKIRDAIHNQRQFDPEI